ncbi:glutathione S-transferase family protein [Candidatus Binatia bacterium]|nr:glutathione S-transferase family protein [Candidatus Binatia bacterium]
MTDQHASAPLLVYGTDCSYYTGKLETYLRAKGIAYRLVPFGEENMRRAARHTGVVQIPQVECPDGSWLVDTTLIIAHFERTRREPSFTPVDPATAFVSRLVEDYADEWLWRPAMHYRWSFPTTAALMSAWLAEHVRDRRVPEWLKRLYWRRRQHGTFVAGDGVAPATRIAIESAYLDTLATLEAVFAIRPFVLGERPTAADFGFMGPLFRHFFSDPAPARIMRERAPAVHEWVARMWNLRPERIAGMPMPERIPDDLGALLATIGEVYLPYLDANAAAFAKGDTRVSYPVRGTTITEPVKPYRVWCRDRLRTELVGLDADARSTVERALGASATARLAAPSPRPIENLVAELPLTTPPKAKPVDSWWRR